MTVQIQFYHLTTTPLERALPKLVEKAFGANFRILIACADDVQAERLSELLWTYDQDSFLPHGTKADGHEALQPILLTTSAQATNEARLLMVVGGMLAENAGEYERVADMFDGQDEAAVAAARTRWAAYKEKGFSMTYLRQNETGGWDKKAVA